MNNSKVGKSYRINNKSHSLTANSLAIRRINMHYGASYKDLPWRIVRVYSASVRERRRKTTGESNYVCYLVEADCAVVHIPNKSDKSF